MTIGPVPAGCRERLTDHYGERATRWLERIPSLLAESAQGWGLRLVDYYDAGHASVLATALNSAGTKVLLKAWFERERFVRETAALRHWESVNGSVVQACDQQRAVACLILVGGVPAGARRPCDAERRVAMALTRLHQHPLPEQDFPRLDDYLNHEIVPRMRRRARRFVHRVSPHCVTLGLDALARRPATGMTVLLHADLYRENIPFADNGSPVVLDPLPMLGDAAFDWAFFTVYHDLAGDPMARLCEASEASGIPTATLLPWCLILCLDGLLYYHQVRDGRESRMVEVMTSLATEGDQS